MLNLSNCIAFFIIGKEKLAAMPAAGGVAAAYAAAPVAAAAEKKGNLDVEYYHEIKLK
jgi:hypothetical protein